MNKPSVVISGASIAGLSTAYWLSRTGWDVTVIERAPTFRDGGQNVDVRGIARDVLKRMDLFDKIKAQNTTETGTVLVDADGKVIAELSSEGTDGATAELEVLRGDFARTLYDNLPSGVTFLYDDTIEDVADGPSAVSITTASNKTLTADLLVIAEGVRSSTRGLVFPNGVELNRLGINMVFGTIPRTSRDDRRWRWYNTVGGRQVHLRPDNHGMTRAILAYTADDDLSQYERKDIMPLLRERFADAGWEAPRVLEGFETSDDVYADHLMQVRMEHWHQGRVVLAGDAGWCVTPIGGGGASLALTSGYVLAAYLKNTPNNRESALAAYEKWMRPLVEQVQKLPPGIKQLAFPQTKFGLFARNVFNKALTSPVFKPFAAKMMQIADTDQELPPLTM